MELPTLLNVRLVQVIQAKVKVGDRHYFRFYAPEDGRQLGEEMAQDALDLPYENRVRE